LVLAHLFAKILRPGDSEGTFSVIELSCHLLLPVQPLKGRGSPLSALLKDTTSELAGLFFTLYPFHVERYAREAVNTNFLSLLVRLDEGMEPRTADYAPNAITTRPRDGV